MKKGNYKARIAHELKEFLVVFLILAPFVVSFAIYRMYLAGQPGSELYYYGTALMNALLLSKIILTGEIAGLGKRSDNKPLIISTVHKAVVFAMLYLAFHVLESTVRGLLHGQAFFDALQAVAVAGRRELIGLGFVILFGFIPFFALREIRRVLGEDEFRHLFFGNRKPPHSDELERHAVAQ
jgi:hypothetical protein